LQNEELRRAIEEIKLRAPIEDVVRERVPGLRKAGSLWVACCPFHEERTPSFKVDPRKGFWHCYGACSSGGDAIGFLQRIDNLAFLEALEILAARTGVELPRRRGGPEASGEDERALGVLELGRDFFRRALGSVEGQAAARYLRGRRLADATVQAFGLGYAPEGGHALVDELRSRGVELALAERVAASTTGRRPSARARSTSTRRRRPGSRRGGSSTRSTARCRRSASPATSCSSRATPT
jgi:DNA primase